MKFLLTAATLLLTSFGFGNSGQDPQDLPKPVPEHKVLFESVGTWDAVIITQGPDGKELRDTGKMTTEKRGEFHTIDNFEGKFMDLPFTGHGINSYCPVRKKYLTTWVDSMAASPLLLTGDYDKKQKTLTMRGECVGMSGKLEPCSTVIQLQDADHYAFEMHGAGPDSKDMRMLRIEYTRKK